MQYVLRHVAKSKNLGGQVVMRRAAAARRRILTFQNLGGAASNMPGTISEKTVFYEAQYEL